MKKILSGFLGLFLTIGLVAGTGYALFSSQAQLNGMVLGTATPGLEISLDGDNFQSNWYLPDYDVHFAPLLPGEMDWGEFWLQNTSKATTDPLNLNLAAKITSASGHWGELSNAIQARICFYDDTPGYHCDTTKATNWYTLAQWNASEINLPENPLIQGASQHYTIVFRIDSTYGNEIAGKTISNMNIAITGTQVP